MLPTRLFDLCHVVIWRESMSPVPRAEVSEVLPALQQEIARLAGPPEIRHAFAWLRLQEAQFAAWQLEMARIAAPPFGERARGEWLAQKFIDLGLEDVHCDDVGNVFGISPGRVKDYVAISAHIDTVFPAGTPLNIRQQGARLYGPGVSDNGAGVTALLAVAGVLGATRIRHAQPFLFIGNVGEEGEGDLRGMRHIFSIPRWKEAIRYNLVLDGAGSDTIVAEALGSRRFEVIVRGPGGHSWSDFGTPNPIAVLARAIESFVQTPVPTSPKTTFNIGVVRGGTSVNSIPESASMRVDVRSSSAAEIDRIDLELRRAIDQSIQEEQARSPQRRDPLHYRTSLSAEMVPIGNRPGGELDPNARAIQIARAVDFHLGNSAQIQRASTDANIPISMGREAIAIGAGGNGGGAHTLQEWFDPTGRAMGLTRVLLISLALAGAAR